MKIHELLLVGLLIGLTLINPAYATQSVSLEALDGTATYGTVTVTTSATAIPTTALNGRKNIIVINTSTGTIYLGSDSSVTTANGFQLKQDTSVSLDWGENITLYGIIGSGTADVRYIESRG